MSPLGKVIAAVWLGAALDGCALVKLDQDSRETHSSTILAGRISAGAWEGPVVVAAYSRRRGEIVVAHHVFLHEPGGYELIVPRGSYRVFAFGDSNGNLVYDAGEPAGEYGPEPVAASGDGVISNLDVVLSRAPSSTSGVPAGTAFASGARGRPHSTQIGALARLDDPVFSADSGRQGYWAPGEFYKEIGGNVYFLEPYDPQKTPILFVHGAGGSPQDWRYFFDHIDRARYQPWFFYYPSGARIEAMSHLLMWKLFNLQLKYRFERIHITAHSMGGLVVRSFLLDHGSQFPCVKLFVSLATPWGGDPMAALGVKYSPAVIPSWRDMQPGGRFMTSLFTRRLPRGVEHYLLFGYGGGPSLIRPGSDGTVTLVSQLRRQAQGEARMIYGFDEDHAGILSSPQVLAQYRAILDSVDKAGAEPGARPGSLRVQLSYGGPEVPRPLALLALTPVDGRSRVTLTLAAEDSGRDVGPIPAGTYDAMLLSAAYRSEPRKARVTIAAGQAATLGFRLVPQGTLLGFVGADVATADGTVGGYRAPHPTVRISSIVLTGVGGRRALAPRPEDLEAFNEHYAAGEDHATGPYFSFVNLPEGEYELTIVAEGYRPYSARYHVVPGRIGQLRPIVLAPAR